MPQPAPLLPPTVEVGPQVPLRADCQCRANSGRNLPIWLQTLTADAVRRQLNGVLNPDMVLFTYRCSDCRQKVVITLGILFDYGTAQE